MSLFGTYFGTRKYPKVQNVTNHPFPDNLHINSQKKIFADPSADWAMISNRPSNKMNMEAGSSLFFCNMEYSFFSQINFDFAAILFYYHHILCSVMAFDTKYLGVCLSIKNSVSLDRKAHV